MGAHGKTMGGSGDRAVADEPLRGLSGELANGVWVGGEGTMVVLTGWNPSLITWAAKVDHSFQTCGHLHAQAFLTIAVVGHAVHVD